MIAGKCFSKLFTKQNIYFHSGSSSYSNLHHLRSHITTLRSSLPVLQQSYYATNTNAPPPSSQSPLPSNKTTKTTPKKKLSKSSKEWLRRQLSDPYVKLRNSSSTQQSNGIKFRSRAGFKLQQIDEKMKFIQFSNVVIDLGAAPGAWTQYAAKSIKKNGVLISVDLLPMDPLPESEIGNLKQHVVIQGDFTEEETLQKIQSSLLAAGKQTQADTIISDMAPNTTGNQSLDHGRIMQLCHSVVDFVEKGALKPGGTLLMKIFSGSEEVELRKRLKPLFTLTTTVKPDASRQDSSETYIYSRNFLPVKISAEDDDSEHPTRALPKKKSSNKKSNK